MIKLIDRYGIGFGKGRIVIILLRIKTEIIDKEFWLKGRP